MAEDDSHRAVRDVIAQAISEPDEVLNDLGEPKEAGFHKLCHGDDMTILNVVWAHHVHAT